MALGAWNGNETAIWKWNAMRMAHGQCVRVCVREKNVD